SSPVGGGCINPSARLETDRGDRFFLKWNPAVPVEMFSAEADGLRALGAPGAVRVPEVGGWGGAGTPADPGWLLLEFVPQGSPGPDYGRRLGDGLAHLHAAGASGPDSTSGAQPAFGWHQDNFIGSLPQKNDESPAWADFWRDRRIEPQLEMARDRGIFTGPEGRILDELLNRMDELLPEEDGERPALLHGDLWSGNYYPGPDGEPVLIDPAVFRGAGGVDLAMMELFGSFPRGFREAYGSVHPIPAEYDAFRRDLYQLYYLLVHVNLFGGGYVGGSLAAARRVLGAV
ncbi:fructosamine kinase family protein, partial [Gemmatimonadota bacterium]